MSNNNILKRLSPIHLVSLICLVLVLAIVGTSLGFFIGNTFGNNEKDLDYMEIDLSEYVELGDYSNLTGLEIDTYSSALAEAYRDLSIKNDILAIVAGEIDKSTANTTHDKDAVITVGDKVKFYYRGYVSNDDGTKDYRDGMSNFTSSAENLTVGGDKFIAGYMLALDGTKVGNYPRFSDLQVKGEDKFVEAGAYFVCVTLNSHKVVYNEYSGVEGKADVKTETVLIDITDKAKVDETYGAGFYDYLIGKEMDGANVVTSTTPCTVTKGEDTYKYTSISIKYAIPTNYLEGYNNATIEVVFPYDYAETSLQGKTGYFEVLVEDVTEYDFNIDGTSYVLDSSLFDEKNENLIIAALTQYFDDEKNEDLKKEVEHYEGENIYAKFKSYLEETYETEYEESLKAYKENAIIKALVKIANTESKATHPNLETLKAESVLTFIDEYEAFVSDSNNKVSKDTFKIEDYAKLAFNDMPEDWTGFDWKAKVEQSAADYYTARFVVYSIVKANNLTSAKDEVLAEYRLEWIKSFCTSNDVEDVYVRLGADDKAAEFNAAYEKLSAAEKDKYNELERTNLEKLGYENLEEEGYIRAVFNFLNLDDSAFIYKFN